MAESKTAPPAIYAALVAVGAELAKVGIAKDRQNEAQRFFFRGIDQVMNVVSPILGKNHVLFLIHYYDYPDVDRVTGKGTTLIYAKVRGEFTFMSALDGSSVSVTTFGVAMDSGDKATNKAMSAALKYALLQTFLIPTEAGDDADASSPDDSIAKAPDGLDEWFEDLLLTAEDGTDALRAAWRQAPGGEAWRKYVTTYRLEKWDATKDYAKGVTNNTTDATTTKKRTVKP